MYELIIRDLNRIINDGFVPTRHRNAAARAVVMLKELTGSSTASPAPSRFVTLARRDPDEFRYQVMEGIDPDECPLQREEV